MVAGIIGVPLGSYLVQRLRPRHTVKCDALVCASGLLVSAPFVYASLVVASHSIHWCFVCMFIAELSLNLCWSIVADILLVSLVERVKRAFARLTEISQESGTGKRSSDGDQTSTHTHTQAHDHTSHPTHTCMYRVCRMIGDVGGKFGYIFCFGQMR